MLKIANHVIQSKLDWIDRKCDGLRECEFRALDLVANTTVEYNIYHSGDNRVEHGVGFVVIGKQIQRVIRWKPNNQRIFVLSVQGKFFNYSLINVYAPTNDKPDDVKENLQNIYREFNARMADLKFS